MKKKGLYFLVPCLTLAILVFGYSHFSANLNSFEYNIPATIGNAEIFIAEVTTPAGFKKGLSGQTSLGAKQGLLLLFPKSDHYGIWMKDMLFPIDVIWLDGQSRVLGVKENFLSTSYPEVIYGGELSRSVLELSSGFVKKYQINIGDTLVLKK